MLVGAACDLCGGADFAPKYPATIDPQVDPAEYYSTMRKRAGHLAIVRCRGCGLVFSHPRDDPETLQAIYARLADPSYAAEADNRGWVARRRAKQISRRFQPGCLLDVGCSTGVFAAEAASAGWSVTGLDPSDQAIQQAKMRAPQSSFMVGPVESADFAPQSFDLITLWDVLEHVSSPSKVLTKLRPWLKPGGWLLMNVPDAASLPARLMGRRWVLLLREHLWYFTPATMRLLCQKTGYQVDSIHANWVRFSVGAIAARLLQYPGLGRSLGNQMNRLRRLSALAIQFPMGEMTVLAQLEETLPLNVSAPERLTRSK